MDIRKDLKSVESHISRLLSIGEEFRKFERDWVHLRNDEDFDRLFTSDVPHEDEGKVEALYADGRDMAIYMYDSLLAINDDFSRYPTLTAIIEAFKNSLVYENYAKDVPDVAKAICEKYKVNLWSVNHMAALFKKQEKLLVAVHTTLQMLQDSDLYKMENGIKIMSNNIHVSGVSGSSININSTAATASVTKNYNEPTIFAELIAAIKSNGFDGETESKLIDKVQVLAASHQSGSFKEAYQDFMQNLSAHMTVFGPFMGGLSKLLQC